MWGDYATGSVTVERDKLYEQVWSVPGSQLAAQYGISDVGLAKVCRRYKIPRPPRGYWAKLRAGKPVKRSPLPKLKDDRDARIRMQGWNASDEAIRELTASATTEPRRAEPASADHMASHPSVKAARDQLQTAKPNPNGLLCTDPETAPDLRVSPACVDRSLTVLGLMIHRWEAREGNLCVGVAGSGKKAASALAIGDDHVCFVLSEELNETRPVTDPTYRSGRLCLTLVGDERRRFRRRWADTQSQKVERLLTTMLETVQRLIEVKRTERLDEECKRRQEAYVKKRRRAIADLRSREFYWRQELMEHARRWEDAERIRGYLSAMHEAVASGRRKPQDDASFQQWMEWARAYADSIDPTVRGPLPGEPEAPGPENTPTKNLDLTSDTRAVIERLEVKNTDALWGKTKDEVRKASEDYSGAAWNEINRVLEALGYDVSKRERSWW
jgi:hypothetical protein